MRAFLIVNWEYAEALIAIYIGLDGNLGYPTIQSNLPNYLPYLPSYKSQGTTKNLFTV